MKMFSLEIAPMYLLFIILIGRYIYIRLRTVIMPNVRAQQNANRNIRERSCG
jgi:hypothetical protein